MFVAHRRAMTEKARMRREQVSLKSVTMVDTYGAAGPTENGAVERLRALCQSRPEDAYKGDVRLRVLQGLLSEIDKNGFERSAHQVQFHDKFIRACSRVLYRDEWAVHRAGIMRHNGWEKTPSEVMISTPRRFGVRNPRFPAASADARVHVHEGA